MPQTQPARVLLAPDQPSWAREAVYAGGGRVVGPSAGPDALVWTTPGGWEGLRSYLQQAPTVRWVQLPFAGVDAIATTGLLTNERTWTCAKGAYAEPVAEHALTLALAGLRDIAGRARATDWGRQGAKTLFDSKVVILGAGGIATALLRLLQPFRAQTTVVRRQPEMKVHGAEATVGLESLDDVLIGAHVVVLALALTDDTERILDARRLQLPGPEAVLVNVARGRHIDTDGLVDALRAGTIGAASLDVTDPEPLPSAHPLFSLPGALVTPHTANPWSTARPIFAARVSDNVSRWRKGQPLTGIVDVDFGY